MIEGQRLDFVEWNQDPSQKDLVFFFERQGKPVDDTAENLQEFGDPIVSFGFVDELEEDVVDGASDEGTEIEEFAIDTVERRLQKVSFTGIFAVKQIEELF
jgi:hypothetical protein